LLGAVVAQVQHPAFGLIEAHPVGLSPSLQPVQVSLQSLPTLEQINTPTQLGVYGSFFPMALGYPYGHINLQHFPECQMKELCSSWHQEAIRKRDDLLRKSEADFLQAREDIKAKVAEVEHLDSVVKKLKATQELASQDEKLLLMESSLKATQEQLSEQIAETVRQEQNSRKSQTELKTLRERIITSEEEISDYVNLRKFVESYMKIPCFKMKTYRIIAIYIKETL
ncbi:unnamed protein product, partial [Bubo scandiacus]